MSATQGDQKPRGSASDRVVRDIILGLYEGRFVAGQRLAEPDLVAQYGVSRSTVREALKRLSAQGVVDVTHNRGARIRQLSVAEGRNILQILEVIVGLAARLAAGNIEMPGARQELREALEGLTRAIERGDKVEFMRARNRFHRTMTRIGGNSDLDLLLANMQVHLLRNRLVMRSEDRSASYVRIAEAICSGDCDAAERAARGHVGQLLTLLEGSQTDAGT